MIIVPKLRYDKRIPQRCLREPQCERVTLKLGRWLLTIEFLSTGNKLDARDELHESYGFSKVTRQITRGSHHFEDVVTQFDPVSEASLALLLTDRFDTLPLTAESPANPRYMLDRHVSTTPKLYRCLRKRFLTAVAPFSESIPGAGMSLSPSTVVILYIDASSEIDLATSCQNEPIA